MEKYLFLFFLFITPGFIEKAIGQDNLDNRILQPGEMRQDYNYLQKALEETHPGLWIL